MAGLLDIFNQRDPNDPVNMGLLNMSAALGTPVRQGGGVGPAFGAFGQGYQNSQQAEMRRKLMQSQIDENAKTRRFIAAGKNILDTETGKFVPLPPGADKSDLPAAIQELEYFFNLPPERKQEALDYRRQQYGINEVGGVPSRTYRGPNISGTSPAAVTPLSTIEAEVEAARRKKAAQASGQATGEASGTAEVGLAGADLDVTRVENTVSALKNHPGKKWAVGVPIASQLPEWVTLGGTDHADFLAKYKKAQGSVFLEGYKTLKGGGSITQIEGEKAQSAIAAMDRAQSKTEFDKSLDDYLDAYKTGIEKLKKQRALRSTVTPEGIRAVGESLAGPKPAPSKVRPATEMSIEEIRAELENMRNRRE